MTPSEHEFDALIDDQLIHLLLYLVGLGIIV